MVKQYQLISQPLYGYVTGRSRERQVILGFHLPGLLALFFDFEGRFLEVIERSFSNDLLAEWNNPPYDPWNPRIELRPKGFQELRKLAAEIELQEAPISVLPFNLLPEHAVYLNPVPELYRDVLQDPDDFSPEEREQATDWVTNLDTNTFFAFFWS
jgi:hypothetical protein